MSGKSHRRAAHKREQRRKRADTASAHVDVHTKAIFESVASMMQMLESLDKTTDTVAEIETAFQVTLNRVVEGMGDFNAFRLIEVGRLAFLPWAPVGQLRVSPEAGAARLELLVLIALAARPSGNSGGNQVMSQFISAVKDELDTLLQLSQVRAIAITDRSDLMAMISIQLRGTEVWVRNTSYPSMVEATLLQLFDGNPDVRQALITELGFSASDALGVLAACHDLQQEKMNARMQDMLEATSAAQGSVTDGELDPALHEAMLEKWDAAWEPEANAATVGTGELISATGLREECVLAIVERFRLDLGTSTPAQAVIDFVAGRNPLRTHPLVVDDSGRVMLPHDALTVGAVRENLEQHLKSSGVWATYADHRGHLLEARTRAALEKVLPGAQHRDGFEYYVPASAEELEAAIPARYTKRVEGDHLILLDDVALIVEDKAVALSPLSRGGKTTRIRTDLTGIITKAAAQTGRLRDCIERDGGVRIEGEGWVYLGHIREIHTIAVSLDDLSSVSTATAELVQADLLTPANLCWTVSLHDLELITELVDRPSEFLLYLRRRRNPEATVFYSAPDELDLFLYFWESGLWVEPNPDLVQLAFPFLHNPTASARRRHRKQVRTVIASRTDQLDNWYHTKNDPVPAPKPAMVSSPLAPLIDQLQHQGTYGWLSIGATLLTGDTNVQRTMARHPKRLLDSPRRGDGAGRSVIMPVIASTDPAEGWLLMWATRPPGQDPTEFDKQSKDYLRVKKHQLALPRGVAFLYDESTRALLGAHYDGNLGPLPDELHARFHALRSPNAMQHRPPPPPKRRRKKSRKRKK